jgi:predicted metal-dependent phosphoesterase TrpH
MSLGMQYIPAIEIDCTFSGVNLHVLGYGINPENPAYKVLENNVLQQELDCSLIKLELTNQLGFNLKKEQLDAISKNGVYTGEMFGEVLLNDKQYNEHPLLVDYRTGGTRSNNPYVNFYWDFYAQGKPCYTEVIYPTLEEVLTLIKQDHGISVLAHPGNNLKDNFSLFDEMIKLGIDGVEAFSSYHSEEDSKYFYKKGLEHNLLVTCGSDFHGKTKPAIKLGESNCSVDQQQIETELIKRGLIRAF